jgi:hypothetical protein
LSDNRRSVNKPYLNYKYLVLILKIVRQDVLGRLLDEHPEGLALPAGEALESAALNEVVERVEVKHLVAAVVDVYHDFGLKSKVHNFLRT